MKTRTMTFKVLTNNSKEAADLLIRLDNRESIEKLFIDYSEKELTYYAFAKYPVELLNSQEDKYEVYAGCVYGRETLKALAKKSNCFVEIK